MASINVTLSSVNHQCVSVQCSSDYSRYRFSILHFTSTGNLMSPLYGVSGSSSPVSLFNSSLLSSYTLLSPHPHQPHPNFLKSSPLLSLSFLTIIHLFLPLNLASFSGALLPSFLPLPRSPLMSSRPSPFLLSPILSP